MAIAVMRVSLVAVGLVWVLATQTVLAGDAQRYVKPGSQAAQNAACVEETNFMRRNHMELIKHQRDATVHHGIRSTKHSLAGCINCHVSVSPEGHALAINGRDQFCGACHAFSAVDVNCFGCHANVPRGGLLSPAALAAHGDAAAGVRPSAGQIMSDTPGSATGRAGGQ